MYPQRQSNSIMNVPRLSAANSKIVQNEAEFQNKAGHREYAHSATGSLYAACGGHNGLVARAYD